jgi:hypothetical protein
MDIDPQYPHPGASIGVWGWDIVGLQLVDPAIYTDIMSYCDDQWISDYNFRALLMRSKNVNLPKFMSPGARVKHGLVTLDGEGAATWQGSVEREALDTRHSSVPVDVTLANGAKKRVDGAFYRYDHLPGGWLMFPTPSGKPRRVETTIDQRRVTAEVAD